MRKIVLLIVMLMLAGCASKNRVIVMTYNIHHCEGTDGKLDPERISSIIERSDADLVALNEVDNNFGSRSDFENQAKVLAESLDMYYVFGPALTGGSAEKPNLYGNAILSRYPIQQSTNHLLSVEVGHEQRACIAASVLIDGRRYTFMATHLDHRKSELREKQSHDIIDIINNTGGSIILAGDFNCQPPDGESDARTRPIEIILSELESSFAIAGVGAADTIGSGRKIDYIFVSPDLAEKVVSSTVIRDDVTSVASDHLPMITEFEL